MTVHIFAAALLLAGVETSNANKERSRSLDEMQATSAIILDGKVTDVMVEQAQPSSSVGGAAILMDHHRATFEIERTIKGQIKSGSVTLIYSHMPDPRFTGDNPPMLKVGDRFRLFADRVESEGAPVMIRVRTQNAVRPEGIQ